MAAFFADKYGQRGGVGDNGRHRLSGRWYLCRVNPLKLKQMSRSVTYSVVPRLNPRDKEASPKFYAQAQARGDIGIRDMAARIQAVCTVHKSDVYAVLIALEDVVSESIQNGEIVRLGDLCTLRVSLTGKGAPTEDEYSPSLIQRAKINFRPGKVLAGALASLNFSKVAIKYPKETTEE